MFGVVDRHEIPGARHGRHRLEVVSGKRGGRVRILPRQPTETLLEYAKGGQRVQAEMSNLFELPAIRRNEIDEGDRREALDLVVQRALLSTTELSNEGDAQFGAQTIKESRDLGGGDAPVRYALREGLMSLAQFRLIHRHTNHPGPSPAPEWGGLSGGRVPSMPSVHHPQTPQDSKADPNPAPNHARLFGSLIGVTMLLYGLGLGSLDLWAPDEPRYAAIAEELRSFRHGPDGLLLLHLNDTPYTQKPPLYFWLAALVGTPIGRVTELAARLPSAIAGVVAVILTAFVGRMLLGRSVSALLAAGLLATSFRFAFTARRAQLDVLLTACELAAIALFLLLETKRGSIEAARRSPFVIAGLHGALGAAALVKGPVGWLPLIVFAGYLAWEGRGRAFRALVPWWSWVFSVGPLAAWATAAIALAPAGFAETAIGENLVGRFFSGTSHARPFYYYFYQLPLDFLPWSVLLPFGFARLWRTARTNTPQPGTNAFSRSSARFLVAWLVIPFAFFTISAGKRGLYLLPIFPALALTSALVAGVAQRQPHRRFLGAPERHLSLAIAAAVLIEVVVVLAVLPRLNATKSPRAIAIATAAHVAADERIGVFGLSPLEGALGYYAGLRVASLRHEEDLQAFLENGGRVVLLRERDLSAASPLLGLQKIESFRSGRRRLALAIALDRGARPANSE